MEEPQSALDWTIPQVLADVREGTDATEDTPEADCLMVIALWKERGNYDTRFWNVGMSVSEMIALLEVQKQRLLDIMKPDYM